MDNVVYKLGFAPSRAAARQLVNHGHVKVNGEKVDIPSFNVKIDNIITLTEKAQKFPSVPESLKLRDDLPKWLKRQALVGKVSKLPEAEDVETIANEQLIVEYYSR